MDGSRLFAADPHTHTHCRRHSATYSSLAFECGEREQEERFTSVIERFLSYRSWPGCARVTSSFKTYSSNERKWRTTVIPSSEFSVLFRVVIAIEKKLVIFPGLIFHLWIDRGRRSSYFLFICLYPHGEDGHSFLLLDESCFHNSKHCHPFCRLRAFFY